MDEASFRASSREKSLVPARLSARKISHKIWEISYFNTHIHAHSYAEGRDFNDRSEIVSLRLPFNNIPVPLD